MRIKAIQLAMNQALPEEFRDYSRTLDAKDISGVLAKVATTYPDRYAQIAKHLADIGRHSAYDQGVTLRLDDLDTPFDKPAMLAQMRVELDKAKAAAGPNQSVFEEQREAIWQKYLEKIQTASSDGAKARGSNLYNAVASGARGNASQLRMMIGAPGLFQDSNDKTVPIFVGNSFSDGLRPGEYMGSTYGARKATLSTKRATARGGFFLKQLVQAAAPIIVTEDDCGTTNGIDVDPNNYKQIRGRVLQNDTLGVKAGEVLNRHVAAKLRKAGSIMVRSPLTCESADGICAKCAGTDPRGNFYPLGEAVGSTAATAIGEPITQNALNVKHSAGVSSAKKKRQFSGMSVIEQFTQIPDEFPGRAALASEDGRVEAIEDAPQGGKFIFINQQRHYIDPMSAPTVKVGEMVEQGDSLSDGLADPSEMVKLRGLGEGRRYYSERLAKILSDSGMEPDPIAVEMITRANLNSVTVDDEDRMAGGMLPDDEVSYQQAAAMYVPPDDAKPNPLSQAVGMYIHEPKLHLTIGTRLTPKMVKRMEAAGITKALTSPTPAPFTPSMTRLQTSTHGRSDWLAAQHTSYLGRQLATASERGSDTQIRGGTHFAPALAVGEGFASNIRETGRF